MDLPKVRYYLDGRVYSDWLEVEYGEAIIIARLQLLSDGTIGWADQSGLELTHLPLPNAIEKRQEPKDNSGKHQTRNQSGKTAKASGSNRVRKSRKVTQAEG